MPALSVLQITNQHSLWGWPRPLPVWSVHTLQWREPKTTSVSDLWSGNGQSPLSGSHRWELENNSRDSGPICTEHAQLLRKYASGKQKATWKALWEVTWWREGWPLAQAPCQALKERGSGKELDGSNRERRLKCRSTLEVSVDADAKFLPNVFSFHQSNLVICSTVTGGVTEENSRAVFVC